MLRVRSYLHDFAHRLDLKWLKCSSLPFCLVLYVWRYSNWTLTPPSTPILSLNFLLQSLCIAALVHTDNVCVLLGRSGKPSAPFVNQLRTQRGCCTCFRKSTITGAQWTTAQCLLFKPNCDHKERVYMNPHLPLLQTHTNTGNGQWRLVQQNALWDKQKWRWMNRRLNQIIILLII